jgi:predicted O-methyltransferase YrrM
MNLKEIQLLAKVEKIRGELLKSQESAHWKVYGTTSHTRGTERVQLNEGVDVGEMSVKEQTPIISVPDALGRYIYDVVRVHKPAVCIELGTAFGVSALYITAALAANNNGGYLFSIEGSAGYAKIAERTLQQLDMNNRWEILVGSTQTRLPELLAETERVDFAFIDADHSYEGTIWHFEQLLTKSVPGTILLFDDVNWSTDMLQAWDEIKRHPRTTNYKLIHRMGEVVIK